MKKIGNHLLLRQQNLTGILQLLYEQAPVSRIELSRLTGLNKATISSIVSELLSQNLVKELGESQHKRAGRREMFLDINPLYGSMISMEIGVGFISIICTDFAAEILWKRRETFDTTDSASILKAAVKLLKKAFKKAAEKCGQVLGIAIGIPGLVDEKSGKLLYAPNLKWKDIELQAYFQNYFNVPIFVDNEATFAALGESFFGAAKGYRNILYISAGIGIGGGLIINRQIYNGASGFASEFGHQTMDAAGIKCSCGNYGCWETQASQAALFRKIKDAIKSGKKTVLKKNSANITVQDIVDAARENDPVSLDSLNEIGNCLGIGIDSLIKVFDPEIVVFGGRLSLASEFLLPVIIDQIKTRELLHKNSTNIIKAGFGSDASLMGGIAKIFQISLS